MKPSFLNVWSWAGRYSAAEFWITDRFYRSTGFD